MFRIFYGLLSVNYKLVKEMVTNKEVTLKEPIMSAFGQFKAVSYVNIINRSISKLNLSGCQMTSMITFVNKSELGPLDA